MVRAGYIIAWIVAAAIIFIGGRFLIAPEIAAQGYGLPHGADPYLAVKGARDIASGLVVLVLLVTRQRRALGVALLAFAVVPFGDCLIVLANGGPASVAYGIHLVTAAVLIAGGALLLVGERRA